MSDHSRDDFKLHAKLIEKSDDVTQDEARFRAWVEGPNGLRKRLELQKHIAAEKARAA